MRERQRGKMRGQRERRTLLFSDPSIASTTPVCAAPTENLLELPAALPASIACWIDAAWILVDHFVRVVRRVS
jgi:uncharacterized membrane protein (GlpM family)